MWTIDPSKFANPYAAASAVKVAASANGNHGGQKLLCLPGIYDFGSLQCWQIPPATLLYCPQKSEGLGNALFRSACTNVDICQFNTNQGVVSDGISYEDYSPIGAQTIVWGFGGNGILINNALSTITNFVLRGKTHVLYIWQGQGNHIQARFGDIYGARFIAGIGSSSSGDCAFMDLYKVNIYGDASKSIYNPDGEIENRLHGFYARGGKSLLSYVRMELKGSGPFPYPVPLSESNPPLNYPATSHVRCIWTPLLDSTHGAHEGGHPDTTVELDHVDIRIDPNGALDWNDVEAGTGTIRYHACTGSLESFGLQTKSTAPGKIIGVS